jgi:hypothetical protein
VDIGGGVLATESSGAVEQPLPARGDNPGVTVASLPIGGGSGGSSGSGGLQCVRVNWILSSGVALPDGLAVSITGATFEPDVYQSVGSPCEGQTCIGFTFKLSEVACDLTIKPKRADATELSDSEQVSVSMQGRVLCTDSGSTPCKDFVRVVHGSPRTLTVPLPIAPEGPAKPTSGSDPGSGDSVSSQRTTANPQRHP